MTIAGVPVGPPRLRALHGVHQRFGLPGDPIPCRPTAAGLPIGFQLIAPWNGDETLMALAA